jgi:hypothetical protein
MMTLLLGVNVLGLVIGVAVLAGGMYLLLAWRSSATWIHGYYQSIQQRPYRPKWAWRVHRPSPTQAKLMALVWGFATVGLGAFFILRAVL